MASKVHEADLNNFFIKVTHFGAATVRAADLMRWMGMDRQVAGFWAQVQERFQNALEENERNDGWQCMAVQNDGNITIACLDPEGTELKDRWWSRVRILAERPAPGRRKGAEQAVEVASEET